METLQAHRERVRRLRDQFARMLHLRQAIYDAREESWDLRTHWEAAREARINELHEHIDAMAEEIELIREAHFGAPAAVDRMGHAVSAPDYVLDEEAPPPMPVKSTRLPRRVPQVAAAPASQGGLDALMDDDTDASADHGEPDAFAEAGLDVLMGEDDAEAGGEHVGDLAELAEPAGDEPSADAGAAPDEAAGRFHR
jgi:hypothetical protein